jgi:ferredoxin-NADP reductase
VPLIRKVRCTVKRIDDHGDHVYTLELAPEKEIPAFHPGQFLHLALDAYDPSGFWPDSRAFSIASSPSDRSQLKISYSVKGKFTARMEKELHECNKLWVKLPYGDFLVNDADEVVLIAGGTGITAFSAFLYGLKPETKQEISLFYGARSENLLLFREMLSKVARTIPNFHWHYALENAPQSSAHPDFQTHIGRLDIDWIWPNIPAPIQAIYFLSGPPAMLKSFSNSLGSRGIPSENIRIDAWE